MNIETILVNIFSSLFISGIISAIVSYIYNYNDKDKVKDRKVFIAVLIIMFLILSFMSIIDNNRENKIHEIINSTNNVEEIKEELDSKELIHFYKQVN